MEIRLVVWYSFHANKRDYFLFEGQRFLSNFRRVARWRDQRWSSGLLGKWHAFAGWETHFQLVKPYFWWDSHHFIYAGGKKHLHQTVHEWRAIASNTRSLHVFSFYFFLLETFIESSRLPYLFLFHSSPIISNCFCHHCCLFWSRTHHHSNLVFLCCDFFNFLFAFFCVDAQLLEEMQMWHEFGRTMERMSHPVRLNCFCHPLVWLSVVCKGSK